MSPEGFRCFSRGFTRRPLPNPDFFGLADFRLGIPVKEIDLGFQFLWKPEVIRIEKGQPLPGGHFQAPVPGGADSLPGLARYSAGDPHKD